MHSFPHAILYHVQHFLRARLGDERARRNQIVASQIVIHVVTRPALENIQVLRLVLSSNDHRAGGHEDLAQINSGREVVLERQGRLLELRKGIAQGVHFLLGNRARALDDLSIRIKRERQINHGLVVPRSVITNTPSVLIVNRQ